jgi:hypothetical protein
LSRFCRSVPVILCLAALMPPILRGWAFCLAARLAFELLVSRLLSFPLRVVCIAPLCRSASVGSFLPVPGYVWFSQLDWLLASDDCLPIPLRPLGPQLSIAGLAMKFGHRALLVPAPAVNSYIFIALARAAVDFAASASQCRRCFRVFCALCKPAFDRCWCYIFWLLSRRFAMPPRLPRALLPYAAFAPSSGIGLGIRPLAPQL